jgi:hypothetical protein
MNGPRRCAGRGPYLAHRRHRDGWKDGFLPALGDGGGNEDARPPIKKPPASRCEHREASDRSSHQVTDGQPGPFASADTDLVACPIPIFGRKRARCRASARSPYDRSCMSCVWRSWLEAIVKVWWCALSARMGLPKATPIPPASLARCAIGRSAARSELRRIRAAGLRQSMRPVDRQLAGRDGVHRRTARRRYGRNLTVSLMRATACERTRIGTNMGVAHGSVDRYGRKKGNRGYGHREAKHGEKLHEAGCLITGNRFGKLLMLRAIVMNYVSRPDRPTRAPGGPR